MKAYKGNRGIAPLILNLDTGWRQVVNLTPPDVLSPGKKPDIRWIEDWVGPRAGEENFNNNNNVLRL